MYQTELTKSIDTFTVEVYEDENRKTFIRIARVDTHTRHPCMLFEKGDEAAAHKFMGQIAALLGVNLEYEKTNPDVLPVAEKLPDAD